MAAAVSAVRVPVVPAAAQASRLCFFKNCNPWQGLFKFLPLAESAPLSPVAPGAALPPSGLCAFLLLKTKPTTSEADTG